MPEGVALAVLLVEVAEETTMEVELLVGVGVDGWGAAEVAELLRNICQFLQLFMATRR
jgi:hypothetical protein